MPALSPTGTVNARRIGGGFPHRFADLVQDSLAPASETLEYGIAYGGASPWDVVKGDREGSCA